ncbi:MAG: MFS transporter [Desulfovibrio aminophilus]|uniref:MFS transporter n=1 Tax=Desulfovibrio aminophilus TaxID=81425 RepID=UPI0039EC88C3
MFKPAAGSPGMVLFTVCIAQFLAPFMLTSVGVALPSLGRELGASALQLSLVEQLYVLSLAMTMLTFGRWGDIVGRRRIYLAGLSLYTVMTFSLGFTQGIGSIMAQRFVQGLGAAMYLSGSLALVASVYPPEVRGRVIGAVSAATYVGLSLGPVIGGYVTSHFGWRSVFLMVVPLGLAAVAACLFGMRDDAHEGSGERMDWTGALVYALGVGLFMLGAAHAGEMPLGPGMIAAGIVVLALFLRLEARGASPLLDMALLRGDRAFTLGCLAALGNYAATFGITFLASLYLQYVKGLSPREAGLVLLAMPVIQVAVTLQSGRLADRMDPGRLATIGMLMSTIGLLLAAATCGPDMPLWLLALELMLIGAGFGVFVTPNSASIMGSVDRRRFGLASGMIAAMRTLGMAASMTSVALIFSVFMGRAAISQETLPEFLSAMRAGLALLAAFSCLGVLVSLGRIARGGPEKGRPGGE